MANPMFTNIQTFEDETTAEHNNVASFKGIALKTIVLLLLTVAACFITIFSLYTMITEGNEAALQTFVITLVAASIIGFVAVMLGRNFEKLALVCGVIYSLCEGLFFGATVLLVDLAYPGVASMAIAATVVVFLTMLILYATKLVKVTSKFIKFLIVFGISLVLIAILTSIIYICVPSYQPNIYVCLIFEFIFLLYGAFTLLANFEEATRVVDSGCSKNAEWSVALGLEVSLLYIYIEALRLLVILYQIFGKNN